MSDQVVDVLFLNKSNVNKELSTVAWESLRFSQEAAYNRILKLIGLFTDSVKLKSTEYHEMQRELKVQTEFQQLVFEKEKLIIKSLLLLKGKISRIEYFKQSNEYIHRAKSFISKYYYFDVVNEFETQIEKLESFNESV